MGEVYRSYTQTQKIEAVKTYLIVGSIQAAARMLKFPEQTVYQWSRQPWWVEVLADLKNEDELILSTRLKKVLDKSLDVVEDRLEKGDFVYDQKTGQMRRKPVSMRDAHKVAMDSTDKRTLILSRQTPLVSQEQVDDKLVKLAHKFAEIINKRTNGEAIDVRDKNEVASDNGSPSTIFLSEQSEAVPEMGSPE